MMRRDQGVLQMIYSWLKIPVVGPILCLGIVMLVVTIIPDLIGWLLVVFLLVVGLIAVRTSLARGFRYILRR